MSKQVFECRATVRENLVLLLLIAVRAVQRINFYTIIRVSASARLEMSLSNLAQHAKIARGTVPHVKVTRQNVPPARQAFTYIIRNV
jgi:hypothetical protein